MMDAKQAVEALRRHDTLSHSYNGINVYHCLSVQQAKHIADIIESLQAREAEYAEYVRKLEAVAKAAEKCKKAYDDGDNYEISFTRTAIWDALADWRGGNETTDGEEDNA